MRKTADDIQEDSNLEEDIELNEDATTKTPPKRRITKHDSDNDAEGCHCYDSTFPKGKLPPPPPLKMLEPEDKPTPKKGKDGLDKAMDILDEYYEGVPVRDPEFDMSRED